MKKNEWSVKLINMKDVSDTEQLREKGITEEQLNKQLERFRKGFPYLKLYGAAGIGKGIFSLDDSNIARYVRAWDKYCKQHKVMKFVPASGAASRMFKNLYAFLNGKSNYPQTNFELAFFNGIGSFPFSRLLNEKCKELYGKDVNHLIFGGEYKKIVSALLQPEGLNYGNLPKGLLLFHRYRGEVRTPVEEHLAEGALYARSGDGKAHVHFTVSHDHLPLFKALLAEKLPRLSQKYKTEYDVTFSEQKPSTDTIAVTPKNELFRTADGKLLFRPGGHGSLIENLNDLDADVVFIKNIDNVLPDRLKDDTIREKKLLAGVLVETQRTLFGYLDKLDSGDYDENDLWEMQRFLSERLCCFDPKDKTLKGEDLARFLHSKFNRPTRVCAMVRNTGEPGGGPFLAYGPDGTVQPQILESVQIDMKNVEASNMFESGSHFNPADLVCGLKDYKGRKFNLPDFVDENTGFISRKSKDGRDLKALEHPGLWNGAMSDWNTIFVEVSATTFSPVKTVNDLLRPEHR
jgi:hypothetical protein